MIYRFKSGAHVKGVSAQVVGEVCADLESNGNLTPRALVDVSRPEDAPLHGQFEWNDEVAAERYRETQAQYLIRSVVVEPKETKVPVRAFVSVPSQDEGEDEKPKPTFKRVDHAMQDRGSREYVLAQAFKELASFRLKYIGFSELADVFTAIDKLVA